MLPAPILGMPEPQPDMAAAYAAASRMAYRIGFAAMAMIVCWLIVRGG